MNRTFLTFAVALGCLAITSIDGSVALAGELRLRDEVVVGETVVRVADVAVPVELSQAEWRAVAGVELFPTPAPGDFRAISAAAVREAIALRASEGESIAVHGRCRVTGGEFTSRGPNAPRLIADETVVFDRRTHDREIDDVSSRKTSTQTRRREARARVSQAAKRHLAERTQSESDWRIEFILEEKWLDAVLEADLVLVDGGQSPWTGRQMLVVHVDERSFNVKAMIEREGLVVVAARDLLAGQTLTEADVRTVASSELPDGGQILANNAWIRPGQDLIGKTLLQNVVSNKPIPTAALKKTILVRRGELITVFSVAPGLKVKASAKALADGTAGELVLLEQPDSKKQFQARVTGAQEATVMVDAPVVREKAVEPAANSFAARSASATTFATREVEATEEPAMRRVDLTGDRWSPTRSRTPRER